MNENANIPNTLTKWQFIIMMLICVVVWAFAFSLIQIALNDLSPVNLTIMRFFVVCLVLLPIFILQRKRFSKLYRKDVAPIFILGFFGVMIYHFGLNYGEQYVSPGAASLIIATIPIFIVILAFVFLKEKIAAKKMLGVVLSLAGVLVITIWGKENASFRIEYIFGALAILIAAVMGALYTIAGKKLLERYSALSLTIYAMLLGSLGLIPFLNISLISELSSMSIDSWISVLFLGIFSTVVGYLIWYVALDIKSASELSVYLYFIPVLSTLISYFFFGTEITILFIIGGLLVIAGLALVNINENRPSQ